MQPARRVIDVGAESDDRVHGPQDFPVHLPEIRIRKRGVAVKEPRIAAAHTRNAAELRLAGIPVVNAAEIELHRTKGRTDTTVQIDLGGRIRRELHACRCDAAIDLHIRRNVVAGLEIGKPGGAAI
jgi:hypothetical protein